MKVLALLFLPLLVSAQPAQELVRHDFVIRNFHTELGPTLPEAHIVYTTIGTLNAGKSNAVLLPSHDRPNSHVYDWQIGADKPLNPAGMFMVMTELFGNGRSSSPSNTPEPFHGPRFPVMTIRDNVNAVHQLLTEELRINH